MSTSFEIGFLVVLIFANGLLAMAEIAIASSNKVRLENEARQGKGGARLALNLLESPNNFLAAIQIGISLVGILSGAFGGATFSDDVGQLVGRIDLLAPYSTAIGFVVVVVTITYGSLLIGELVPKRIALNNPEAIAMRVARPMTWLTQLTYPIVRFLGLSTNVVLRLLGFKLRASTTITQDELRLMIDEATQAGVFAPSEQMMLNQILTLDDQRVTEIMTPRPRIVWLDINEDSTILNQTMRESGYSYFPVIDSTHENVLGLVSAKKLWGQEIVGQPIDLQTALEPPFFIPENTQVLNTLELFSEAHRRLALIVDEYGAIQGLVTITDIVQAIVGNLLHLRPARLNHAKQRADGTWLVDGVMMIDDFEELLAIKSLPQREKEDFQTVAGFILAQLGRIPSEGESFTFDQLNFEILDMDGKRIDKLLVKILPAENAVETMPPASPA